MKSSQSESIFNQHRRMTIEKELLTIFGISDTLPDELKPQQRSYHAFEPENKCGALLGLLRHAPDEQDRQLIRDIVERNTGTTATYVTRQRAKDSLNNEDDKTKANEAKKLELLQVLEKLLDKYVGPFYRNYRIPSSRQPSAESISSSSSSVEQSKRVAALKDADKISKDSSISSKQKRFSRQVGDRDKCCCFCWRETSLEAAHIVAQKNIHMEHDTDSILIRSELESLYDVRNGICLCKNCHDDFDQLVAYIETGSEPWHVEYIDRGTCIAEENYARAVSGRNICAKRLKRKPLINDVLYLDFGNDDSTKPSQIALQFHKTACLIWKMAGGADKPIEDDLDDVDDGEWEEDLKQVPYDTGNLERADRMNMFFESLQNIEESEEIKASIRDKTPSSVVFSSEEIEKPQK